MRRALNHVSLAAVSDCYPVSYVWEIRPLTEAELTLLVQNYSELLGAMIDMAPERPMPEDRAWNSVFHMLVEFAPPAGTACAVANSGAKLSRRGESVSTRGFRFPEIV